MEKPKLPEQNREKMEKMKLPEKNPTEKMEKTKLPEQTKEKLEKTKLPEQKKSPKQSSESTNRVIWDCGSSLYDSFELRTFQKQLDSAITSRTLSMPHLSDRRLPPPPSKKKATSKISRSFQKLIRAVFRPKSSRISDRDASFGYEEFGSEEYYIYCDRPPALPRIPEAPEFDGLSPDVRSLVRRTASERFAGPTACIGISCS